MKTTPATALDTVVRGIWRENPVFALQIALCPALAVTDTGLKALAMGLATLVVLLLSMITLSVVDRLIPEPLRITARVVVIAAWVTALQTGLASRETQIAHVLGVFLPLIVVNCIVLAHDVVFPSPERPGLSLLQGFSRGLGFTGALLGIGVIRELLGYGSFFGKGLFGPSFQPWDIMTIPAGGFFVLGAGQLLFAWFKERPMRRESREEASHVG